MTRTGIAVRTAALVAAFALGMAAEPQTMDQAGGGAPAGSAVLIGKVVDAETGAPIPGAIVTVAMRVTDAPGRGRGLGPASGVLPGTTQLRLVSTSEGKFVVRDLPQGNVALSATAAGFVDGSYGQTRPGGPPTPFVVTGETRVVEVAVRLWRTAAVAGLVTDDRGEPLPGLQVRAMRRTYTRGQQRLVAAGFTTSDDRGAYRIANLTPGDYLVMVPQTQMSMPAAVMDNMVGQLLSGNFSLGSTLDMATSGAAMVQLGVRVGDMVVGSGTGQVPVPGEQGRWLVYTTRFFPGASSSAQAAVLSLAPGEERGNSDIALSLTPTVSVSGVVTGPDGPVANIGVRLHPVGERLLNDQTGDAAAATTRSDGTFTMVTVPVGEYVLRVLKAPRPGLTAAQMANIPEEMRGMLAGMAGGGDTRALFAEMPLSVPRDVAGLTVSLGSGASLNGRVEFEGAATPPVPLEGMTVSLTPLDNDWMSGPGAAGMSRSGSVAEDGTFSTAGYPPGTYVVAVGGRAVPGWYPKTVLVNGKDALFNAFTLEARDVNNVVVTYAPANTRGRISGTVQAPPGYDQDISVVVFPAAWREWVASGMAQQLTRTIRPSDDGTFTVQALLPRQYLVVAVPRSQEPIAQDPTGYEALVQSAMTVTVDPGGTAAAALRLVEGGRR
jgi:hypothetical protein